MISSSKLELVAACPGAITLPWHDSPNEHSAAGTERHAADESAINSGDGIEEYESRWPGLAWRAEVAYVYDISSDTSRYVGCGIGRDYGTIGPFEVPGTIDAEGRGPGVLVVVDKKGFERQESAARHKQVRFLALAAARHQPADRITVAIRPELGPMDIDEIDPGFDLDVVAHEVKQLVIDSARIRSEAHQGVREPVFVTGRHCRWCPAFNDCPKQKELRALVVRDEEDPELALSTFVDDESAADVLQLWKRIGILHKRIGEQLYRHAAVRPIPVGPGRMFGKVEKQGNERLDGDVVYEVVKAQYGQELADRAVVRTATKTRLAETLKGKRGAVPGVLAEVRVLGGITRKATTAIEEYEIGPKLVTDSDEEQPQLPAAGAPF
jgi:hypothetical protein